MDALGWMVMIRVVSGFGGDDDAFLKKHAGRAIE